MLWGIRQTKFPHERATLIKATGGLSDCTSSLHQTPTNFGGGELSLSLSRFSPPLSFRVTLLSRPLLSRLPLFSYNLLQPLLIFPRATRCVEPIFGYCSLSAFRETPLPYLGSVSKQRTQRTSPGSC